jgi:prepilin-type N-terminal cleavage/methylation domain-containing protein
MRPRQHAFTLIELLVVIAIIGILMAAARPSVVAANDRAKTATCETRLAQIDLALRQYVEDHGRMPGSLNELLQKRYLLNSDIIRCSKTKQELQYRPLAPDGDGEQIVASCVFPQSPRGERPHGQGDAYVLLRLDGETAVARQ